jgi:transglutaminase-like putative cysteine protease
LKVRLEGKKFNKLALSEGRQSFQDNILTVTRENQSNRFEGSSLPEEEKQKYLRPTPLVQSDHPEIIAQALRIVSPSDSVHEKTLKIVAWVYKNIEKKPVISIPSALEVLRHKQGDCNEHAVLVSALLRAAGVPAQIETGLVYLDGRFYYHAWNRAFTDRWMTADAVFNQLPTDVTHIRLASGEDGGELDLLGFVGRIKLEFVSTSYD